MVSPVFKVGKQKLAKEKVDYVFLLEYSLKRKRETEESNEKKKTCIAMFAKESQFEQHKYIVKRRTTFRALSIDITIDKCSDILFSLHDI